MSRPPSTNTVPAVVVFSDLDGCLLDSEDYDHTLALPALRALAGADWALMACSGKSQAELDVLVELLDLRHPFIVENGGAIVFPRGVFEDGVPGARCVGNRQILGLGAPRPALIAALRESAAEAQVRVRGFADMDVGELVRASGLSPAVARLALQREYDEPFLVDQPQDLTRLAAAVARRGLTLRNGGRFWHVMGGCDKGLAVRTLRALYRRSGVDPCAIGIGDAETDIALLQAVDRRVLMPRRDGDVEPALLAAFPEAECAPQAGPRGWNLAMLALLDGQPLARCREHDQPAG